MKRSVDKYPLVAFYVLAFLLTWANWVPRAVASRSLTPFEVPEFLGFVAGYGPALAAVIVVAITAGRAGLRRLFGRLTRWRVGWLWYVVALTLPLLIFVAALAVHDLLGGTGPDPSRWLGAMGSADGPFLVRLLSLFLIFTLGFDGLGEELGWRGYALPKLQARRDALTASLTVGLLWALWHLPYALTVGGGLSSVPLALVVLDVVAAAVTYTWLFNSTRGSVLVAIVFHAAGNTAANLLPILPPAADGAGVFAASVAVRWVVAIAVVLLTGRAFLTKSVRTRGDLPVEAG